VWLSAIGWTATAVFWKFITSSKRRQGWQDPGRGPRSLGDLRCRDPFGAGAGSKPHSRNRGCLHLVALALKGKAAADAKTGN
jgi:hypothetical protein